MNFKFLTLSTTRSSLQAQQIYNEIVKLKIYLRQNTLSGKKRIPQITFHRVQLPEIARHKAIDMEEYLYQHNPPPYQIYLVAYYLSQSHHDYNYRYYLSVRYPQLMRHIDQSSQWMNEQIQRLKLRMGLTDGIDINIKGTPGKYNILRGMKNFFWHKDESKEKIQKVLLDRQKNDIDRDIQEFNKFLVQQDQLALQQVKTT